MTTTQLIIFVILNLMLSVSFADTALSRSPFPRNELLAQHDTGPQPQQVAINSDKSLQKMELTFLVNGVRHNYILYTPDSYQSEKQYPLLIVVHGPDSKPNRFIRSTGIVELSERDGFLVAFLHAEYMESWEAMLAAKDNTISALYIRALVANIAAQRNVQSNRIYLAGFSMGGMLVLSAMCELYDAVAAFAVIAAALPTQLKSSCVVKRSISTLMIASRDDPIIPWDGGMLANDFGKKANLRLLSVLDTAEIWRSANGCDARPLIEPLANVDVSDGTTVTRLAFDFNCTENSRVMVYAITGGGHSWPGSRYKLQSFEGPISRDIDASSMIWNYFNGIK